MPTTQYIGSRYVPLLADPVEWSSTKEYEPLTIVTHEGNSYTSRQFVPKGIDIGNEAYWALTGNYNAQIEQYRLETAQAVENSREYTDAAVTQVDEWLTDAQGKYGAKPFAFDTVYDMQAAYRLLYTGAICHTNGFHANGDGGAAWYVMTDTGTANGMDVLACGNMFANLVLENEISIKQIGCVTEQDDIKPFVERLILIGVRNIYIPSGQWMCSELQIKDDDVAIRGDFSINAQWNTREYGTWIVPFSNNQNYIISLGNHGTTNVNPASAINVKNICFSTMLKSSYTRNSHVKNVFEIVGNTFSYFDNIAFMVCDCESALYMSSSWECHFDNLFFRHISGYGIYFGSALSQYASPNLSTLFFNYITFELINNDYIYVENNSNLTNCEFGTINCECSLSSYFGNSVTPDYTDYYASVENRLSIIKIDTDLCDFVISNLDISTLARNYAYINNKKTAVVHAINIARSNSNCSIVCNSITLDNLYSLAQRLFASNNESIYSSGIYLAKITVGVLAISRSYTRVPDVKMILSDFNNSKVNVSIGTVSVPYIPEKYNGSSNPMNYSAYTNNNAAIVFKTNVNYPNILNYGMVRNTSFDAWLCKFRPGNYTIVVYSDNESITYNIADATHGFVTRTAEVSNHIAVINIECVDATTQFRTTDNNDAVVAIY